DVSGATVNFAAMAPPSIAAAARGRARATVFHEISCREIRADMESSQAGGSKGWIRARRRRARIITGRSDAGRRTYRGHQVVVPVAGDRKVRRGAQLEGFNQVMVHVGVDARLVEGAKRRPRRAAGNEP